MELRVNLVDLIGIFIFLKMCLLCSNFVRIWSNVVGTSSALLLNAIPFTISTCSGNACT